MSTVNYFHSDHPLSFFFFFLRLSEIGATDYLPVQSAYSAYCILFMPLRTEAREKEGKRERVGKPPESEPVLAPRQTLTYCNGACE